MTGECSYSNRADPQTGFRTPENASVCNAWDSSCSLCGRIGAQTPSSASCLCRLGSASTSLGSGSSCSVRSSSFIFLLVCRGLSVLGLLSRLGLVPVVCLGRGSALGCVWCLGLVRLWGSAVGGSEVSVGAWGTSGVWGLWGFCALGRVSSVALVRSAGGLLTAGGSRVAGSCGSVVWGVGDCLRGCSFGGCRVPGAGGSGSVELL